MNDREALVRVIREGLRARRGPHTFGVAVPSQSADAILASDWLRDHDAALAAQAYAPVLAALAEFDEWTPYDTRDIGEAFVAESVRDLVAAVRAAASSHPTGNQPLLRSAIPKTVGNATVAMEDICPPDDHPTGNQP